MSMASVRYGMCGNRIIMCTFIYIGDVDSSPQIKCHIPALLCTLQQF